MCFSNNNRIKPGEDYAGAAIRTKAVIMLLLSPLCVLGVGRGEGSG